MSVDINNLLEMFIDMCLIKDECAAMNLNEQSTPSAFPFPDKEILHRVHSGGGLSRQNSNQSARATTPTTTMPSLLNVNDDMSVSILIMDVLIKQVDIIVLEKTFRNTVLI